MMCAMHKFAIGERVIATEKSHEYGLWRYVRIPIAPGGPFGTVVGFCRTAWLVKVVRDGTKTPQVYSMDFWEPSEPLREGNARE